MAQIRISEIFSSLQGEGLLCGTPSTFIRTSGCNLRCWFCDTRYASWEPEGDYWSADQLLHQCQQLEQSHVVITGGEPMVFNAMPELCRLLREHEFHITIETAGTVHHSLQCDLMSLSPKLNNSTPLESGKELQVKHDRRRHRPDIVQKLMQEHEYQLKFVVDGAADGEEVLGYLDLLSDVDMERVLIMPQGTTSEALAKQAEWLLPWCAKHQLRFCPRSHIEWYGNKRGT